MSGDKVMVQVGNTYKWLFYVYVHMLRACSYNFNGTVVGFFMN